MRQPETDLLGEPIALSPRRKLGYAARPGTGPRKQRCSTCAHCVDVGRAGLPVRKRELNARLWSSAADTDIQPNAPACSFWSRRTYAAELRPTLRADRSPANNP